MSELAIYDEELALLGGEGYVPTSAPSLDWLILINSAKQLKDNPDSKLGHLHDKVTGKNYASGELIVTLMKVNTTKAWTPDYDNRLDANGKPIFYCRSRDARRPDPEYVGARAAEFGCAPAAVACATCIHGKWKDNELECPPSLRLVIRLPGGEVRAISAHGKSTKPTDRYVASFHANKLPYSAIRTKILINEEKKGNNDYYVFGFQALMDQHTSAEERAWVLDWLKTFGKLYDEMAAAMGTEAEAAPDTYQGGPTLDAQTGAPVEVPQTNLF